MGFYKDKNILVTGGTGMIGISLTKMLIDQGAKVRVASLDDPSRADKRAEFIRSDLTSLDNCLTVCKDIDYVFHLAGVKGSPRMTKERPASFFVPTTLFNTSMMEAARRSKVDRYLFTSTIGVYSPAEVFREDDVWKTFPSENDKFAGWAKRMGELQAEAYKIEYGWDKISIVRPANVYGPYDNFNLESGMVIPSLIKRVLDKENPLAVWGDGSAIRDFIHSDDVANGMLHVVEKGYTLPVNLGSGKGYSIKELAESVVRISNIDTKIIWDTSKPTGDKIRLMDMTRANSIGFYPKISLEDGIADTILWYKKNKDNIPKKYDALLK